jgi:hypothetical protein
MVSDLKFGCVFALKTFDLHTAVIRLFHNFNQGKFFCSSIMPRAKSAKTLLELSIAHVVQSMNKWEWKPIELSDTISDSELVQSPLHQLRKLVNLISVLFHCLIIVLVIYLIASSSACAGKNCATSPNELLAE